MRTITFLLLLVLFACKKDSKPVMVETVTPTSDGPGVLVTIRGSGFGSDIATTTVSFNGVSTTPESVSDTMIIVRIPANAVTGKLVINRGGQQVVASENFIVLAGSWTQMADKPGEGVGQSIAFSIDGIGYVAMGFNGGTGIKDVYAYDPANNSWTQKADFPELGKFRAVAAAANGKGYVFCGSNGDSSFSKDVWEYDPAADHWTRKNDFPGTKRSGALAISTGTKIYFGTGTYIQAQLPEKDWWEYDPSNDSWIQKADFGGGPKEYAIGVAINNKCYAGMGVSAERDWWEYDPSLNSWKQKSNCPVAETFYNQAFALNNKAYAVCGFVADNWCYDPGTDSWSRRTSHPSSRVGAVAFTIGDKAYLTGGLSDIFLDKRLFRYSEN